MQYMEKKKAMVSFRNIPIETSFGDFKAHWGAICKHSQEAYVNMNI